MYKLTITTTEIDSKGNVVLEDSAIKHIDMPFNEIVRRMNAIVFESQDQNDEIDLLETRTMASKDLAMCETTYYTASGTRVHLQQIASIMENTNEVQPVQKDVSGTI